ncbi:hypothetical protein CRENBAI_013787 [Crenichthys baileyi]|uniref:Uncharacterized protein n=1 Tax=Crenichthys baileyi TaxID=28760 RepID=A0AAV9SQV6_9TELE
MCSWQSVDDNVESLGGFWIEKGGSISRASWLRLSDWILVLRAGEFSNLIARNASEILQVPPEDNCMHFIRESLHGESQAWESRACAEERSKARLYDPEEAFLIPPSATALCEDLQNSAASDPED